MCLRKWGVSAQDPRGSQGENLGTTTVAFKTDFILTLHCIYLLKNFYWVLFVYREILVLSIVSGTQ